MQTTSRIVLATKAESGRVEYNISYFSDRGSTLVCSCSQEQISIFFSTFLQTTALMTSSQCHTFTEKEQVIHFHIQSALHSVFLFILIFYLIRSNLGEKNPVELEKQDLAVEVEEA